MLPDGLVGALALVRTCPLLISENAQYSSVDEVNR